MNNMVEIRKQLLSARKNDPTDMPIFFKTGPGDYAAHDQFLGVCVPVLRQIAKRYPALPPHEIAQLLTSCFNEERLLALFILVHQYQSQPQRRQEIYQFYLKHLIHINNWNLVDASAHLIIGAHLLHAEKEILVTLASSSVLWEKRIAIVATWAFIRHQQFDWTNKIAELLLEDQHDLIHKAVGWMLREMGKRDQQALLHFLNQNAGRMPRTMLRYAIEKLTHEERMHFLAQRKRISSKKE